MSENTLQEKKPIDQMNAQELTENYLKLVETKKAVDERYALLRDRLLEKMKETKALSIKTETYSIVRMKRKTLKVLHLGLFLKECENRNIPTETKVVIDEELMKPVLEALKKTGEMFPGTEIRETEYVTVRLPK